MRAIPTLVFHENRDRDIQETLGRLRQFHRPRLKQFSRLTLQNLLTLVLPLISFASPSADFCYDSASCGPSSWGGTCRSGQKQSPINIPVAKVTTTLSSTRLIINKNYALPKQFFVFNTGLTLKVFINADGKSKCFLTGDGLGTGAFYFSQLHFHWGPNNRVGSEHQIGGRTFPLELHMVHLRAKDNNQIAVLAILFTLSPNPNPALEKILSLAGKVRQPGSRVKGKGLVLTDLFPKRMRMYRYAGSLTTPPCSENVYWTVFQDPVPVSKGQMAKLRKLIGLTNRTIRANYRPLQPAFTKMRRVIYSIRQLKTNELQLDNGLSYYQNQEEVFEPMRNVYSNNNGNGNEFHQDDNNNYTHYYYPNRPIWTPGFGYGVPGDHFHPSKEEWDFWHSSEPAYQIPPRPRPGNGQFWTWIPFQNQVSSWAPQQQKDEEEWFDLGSVIQQRHEFNFFGFYV